jgi:hypothetical protein
LDPKRGGGGLDWAPFGVCCECLPCESRAYSLRFGICGDQYRAHRRRKARSGDRCGRSYLKGGLSREVVRLDSDMRGLDKIERLNLADYLGEPGL